MSAALWVAVVVVGQASGAPLDEDLRDDGPRAQTVVGGPSDEWGRGAPGTVPAWRAQSVTLPRLRFGLGTAGVFAVQPAEYSGALSGGFGISAEAGVIFADRFSVLWRGEAATTVTMLYGSNGVFADLAFGDHFALGLGGAFTLWSQLAYLGPEYVQPFVGFTFPLRAHVTFGGRKGGGARREGWTLSAHVAPGVSLYPRYDPYCSGYCTATPSGVVTVGLGLGYLWW